MVEYLIAYPHERWVSEEFIRMKYDDAVANGVCYQGETEIDGIMTELEHSGLVTFSRQTRSARCWNYFLEAPDGTIVRELRNVPYYDAPHGPEVDDDDEIIGHWHPMEG